MKTKHNAEPILLIGASGFLGSYLRAACVSRGYSYTSLATSLLLEDLNEGGAGLYATLRSLSVNSSVIRIINAAGVSSAATCKAHPDLAQLINSNLPALLTKHTKISQRQSRLLHISTDCVFDGNNAPYRPEDIPAPVSTYGRSKAMGEENFVSSGGDLIVRLSLLIGPSLTKKLGFFDYLTTQLQTGKNVQTFTDEWRSPMLYCDAAEALIELVHSEATGIFHLGGIHRLNRHSIAQRIASAINAPESLLVPVTRSSIAFEEPRPEDLTLSSDLTYKFLSSNFRQRNDCNVEKAISIAGQWSQLIVA